MIRTRELIAWGLDDYAFRTAHLDAAKLDDARSALATQKQPINANPLCEEETRLLQNAFDAQRSRDDLQEEMRGLEWTLAVVDLRLLLAFQRRLSFAAEFDFDAIAADDWPLLMDLAFAQPREPVCKISHDAIGNTVTLESENPNLHLRFVEGSSTPLAVHAGGPFLEVAHYRGRWFLRDGYHRAYGLLRSGVFKVPAVVVYAKSLPELGADRSWFFAESILFSTHPPRVADFLNDALTIEYERQRTRKTIRIRMEESLNIVASGEPA